MRFDLSDDAVKRVPPMRGFEEVEFFKDDDGRVTAQRTYWFQRRGEARILNLMGIKTTAAYWRTNEMKRLKRILRRLNTDGFRCRHCGEEMPLHRNANALYCDRHCQKAHHKFRQADAANRALPFLTA